MKTTKKMRTVIVRTLLILALVFGLTPRAEAQTLAAKGKPAAAKAKSPASAKPSGGTQEGIKVHGHWTIEVRNPDGMLVNHREFENSLQPMGSMQLPNLLTRQSSPGTWSIIVWDFLCPVSVQGSTVCSIVESTSGVSPTASVFPNLAVSAASGNAITLRGNFTATNGGNVSMVATALGRCPASTTPQTCTAAHLTIWSDQSFSAQTLTPPVAVQAGQIVQITVNISFS